MRKLILMLLLLSFSLPIWADDKIQDVSNKFFLLSALSFALLIGLWSMAYLRRKRKK